MNGVPVMFTVDTGASKTVISKGVYKAISEDRRPNLEKVSSLVGAGGELINGAGKAEFSLSLGGFELEHKVIVADVEDDALLGYDILKGREKGPVDLLLSEGKMVFEGNEIPLLSVKETNILRQDFETPVDNQETFGSGLCRAPQEVRCDKVGVLRYVRHRRLRVDPYGECHEPLVRPNAQTRGAACTDGERCQPQRREKVSAAQTRGVASTDQGKRHIHRLGETSRPQTRGNVTSTDQRRCHIHRPGETSRLQTRGDVASTDQGRCHVYRPEETSRPQTKGDVTSTDQGRRRVYRSGEMLHPQTRGDVTSTDQRCRVHRPEGMSRPQTRGDVVSTDQRRCRVYRPKEMSRLQTRGDVASTD